MTQMSIGFASQDWSMAKPLAYPNGCTWYRCVLPAIAMIGRKHTCQVGLITIDGGNVGIKVTSPLYKQDGVFSGHKMIVFKLPMHLANVAAADIAISKGVKVVVDIDDWFEGLPESNRAKKLTDPESSKENNREIYFQVIEMAHALICSTPFLYDFYKKKHPSKPIFMIRNSIDVNRWPKRNTRSCAPVIGWVGATPWRANDLEQLAPFMQNYLRTRNIKFHHAGHSPDAPLAHNLLEIDESMSSKSGMLPMTQLPSLFDNMDIGIVPLNNLEFNYAKSYLKGIEYAAAGLPFVASSTPEYEYLASHGVGRIAKSHDDWVYHFDELMDFNMRKDEAEINLEIIKNQFSIESHAHAWEETYRNIMDIK